MKTTWKKILAIALALTVLFTILPVQAAEVQEIYVPDSTATTLYPSKDIDPHYGTSKNRAYFCSVPKKASSLKSSNKAVATLKQESQKWNGQTHYTLYLVSKKAGTTTVSFKCNGKTYKTKVTVRKYVNPIKSIKIGNTTIAGSMFKSASNRTISYAKFADKKVKVKINLAKGWELTKSYVNGRFVGSFDCYQNGWAKSDSVKNGGTITIKGGSGYEITIAASNKKTGQIEIFYLTFK